MIRLFLKFSLVVIFLLSCEKGEQKPKEESVADFHHEWLKFNAPRGWIEEEPASSMRLAQYRLPGAPGEEDAILSVFHFKSGGGTVEGNLRRWFGQFVQPDGSPTEAHAQREDLTVNGLPVTLVYVTGTFLQSRSPMMMSGPVDEKPGYALLAAIVDTGKGPWFFKATGPQKTIERWQNSFQEFVQTFRLD
ncbi:MAG: hypothetical protein Kow0042_00130 [Calditrichia bacterium]